MSSLRWNEILLKLSSPQVLQTTQWAEVKRLFGWQPHFLVWHQRGDQIQLEYSSGSAGFEVDRVRAAALVLERKAFPGLGVMYSPRGPVLGDWDDPQLVGQVLEDLEDFARGFGVLQLKIDPDLPLGWGIPEEGADIPHPAGAAFQKELELRGWRYSQEQIQFKNTVLVALDDEEEQLLAKMKSKTRYNIRLAARKGIRVRPGSGQDLPLLYRMYADTSVRGGFTIRGADYYESLWQTFLDKSLDPAIDPTAQPLVADYQGLPVAGAVIFRFGDRAWYLHGMSSSDHSEKMAPHLIQWEAMRWAKSTGCRSYDMWGAPDNFNENDSLWGVYRFKDGFGGQISRTLGAWDYSPKPALYALYANWLPRLLAVLRWFGDRRTRGAAGEI